MSIIVTHEIFIELWFCLDLSHLVNVSGDDSDKCNGEEPMDTHRWWTNHGTCNWNDLKWDIKPWGLLMTLPMPTDDSKNPEKKPCIKPNLDTSGGYHDRFYANYISVKARSEHLLEGKQYDAEINIAHFRFYEDKKPFGDDNDDATLILSILGEFGFF